MRLCAGCMKMAGDGLLLASGSTIFAEPLPAGQKCAACGLVTDPVVVCPECQRQAMDGHVQVRGRVLFSEDVRAYCDGESCEVCGHASPPLAINDYQRRAWETAIYPDRGENILYPTLGLCGEAGEVANKVKKALRDDDGVLTPERAQALIAELGDVAWYLAAMCTELGVTMSAVAEANLAKLAARAAANKIGGDGDGR